MGLKGGIRFSDNLGGTMSRLSLPAEGWPRIPLRGESVFAKKPLARAEP